MPMLLRCVHCAAKEWCCVLLLCALSAALHQLQSIHPHSQCAVNQSKHGRHIMVDTLLVCLMLLRTCWLPVRVLLLAVWYTAGQWWLAGITCI